MAVVVHGGVLRKSSSQTQKEEYTLTHIPMAAARSRMNCPPRRRSVASSMLCCVSESGGVNVETHEAENALTRPLRRPLSSLRMARVVSGLLPARFLLIVSHFILLVTILASPVCTIAAALY